MPEDDNGDCCGWLGECHCHCTSCQKELDFRKEEECD